MTKLLAATIALAALCAGPASAANFLQTTSSANTVSESSTTFQHSTAGGATSNTFQYSFSSVNLSKFNTANGILMGATVGIDQDLLSRTTIRTPAPLAPGYSALGRSFAISQFTAPGFPPNVQTFTGFEAATCTGAQCTGGVSAELGGHFAATRVIPLGSLSEYAGTGTVAIERTSSVTVTVEASSGAMAPGLLTTATGLITLGGAPASNVYRVTYDYLNFARPSFDPLTEQQTLNIDFGTLTLGASPVTQIFSMSNLGDEHSAGLSLSSFAPANSTSPFGNTLLAFENLGGGASLTSGFSFAATSVGSFSQSYTLNFADYAPGGVGTRTYQRTINLRANVIAPAVSSVPEPTTWALLIGGFGIAGASIRRRRSATA